MLEYDNYSTAISFNYANGSAVYSTGLGACLSILVSLLTLTYLFNNLHVMIFYKGSNITTAVDDSAFTYNETTTQEDGFRLAVGFDPRWGAAENITDYLEL